MTQFIVEHPFVFAALCVFALVSVDNVMVAWANAWSMRKYYESQRKEAEK